jgi:hypothetical protein
MTTTVLQGWACNVIISRARFVLFYFNITSTSDSTAQKSADRDTMPCSGGDVAAETQLLLMQHFSRREVEERRALVWMKPPDGIGMVDGGPPYWPTLFMEAMWKKDNCLQWIGKIKAVRK